jgi:hypothetical protein
MADCVDERVIVEFRIEIVPYVPQRMLAGRLRRRQWSFSWTLCRLQLLR